MHDEEKKADVSPAVASTDAKPKVAETKTSAELTDDELDGVTGGQRCAGGHG